MNNFPRYESYKDSGVDWLGDIPEHWEVTRVKNVFRLVIEPAPINNDFELLSVYTEIGVKPRKELEERGNKASTTDGYWRVKYGDIVVNKLLAWMGAIGVSKYDGVTSPAYDILRAKRKLNSDFYHYLFRTESCISELKKHSRGIMEMRLRLYFDKFGDVLIPFPDFDEQERIVEFLDRKTAQIDQAIVQKERLIELLQERQQILIHNAVTRGLNQNVKMKHSGVDWIGEIPKNWAVSKLGFYTTKIQTGPFGSQLHSHEYIENGVSVINPSHIINGEIKPDFSQTISSKKHQELLHHTLNIGDIIFGRRGEMGRCALVRPESGLMICGTGSLKISLDKERVYPDYINNLLKLGIMKEWFSLNSVGSTMENLNSNILSLVPLIIPPKPEQIAISEYIENLNTKIETAISCKQKEIEKLKEYKAVLINSAVTGKIKVES